VKHCLILFNLVTLLFFHHTFGTCKYLNTFGTFQDETVYIDSNYLSACAIFQNEAPYLKEWIEYHRLLGVEHFYLYNNSSQDNYNKVLKPYIKKKIVSLLQWPSPFGLDWTPFQVEAYNDCITKVKNITKWLAILDIDEFIVPITYDSLPDMLKDYEGAGGLQIFWQFFGTSNVFETPKEKTLIETFVMKAPKNAGCNYNFKTICQPAVVSKFLVHGAEYRHPWFGLFPHGTRGGAHQPINVDIVRIQHYWTRDEKYFREKKIPRRERLEGKRYSEERIQSIIQGFNQELDESALRFVPALRKKLRK
jgi:hypothetical protein